MRNAITYAASALAAVLGGVAAIGVTLAGTVAGGVAAGLSVTFAASALFARSGLGGHALRTNLGFSFAFVLVTWPMLAVIAAGLWGHWD
jgi:hypothetical protein